MSAPGNDVCVEAEGYARNRIFQAATAVNIVLCVTTVICTLVWFVKGIHRRFALHQNLKTILNVTIFLSCVYSCGAAIGNVQFKIMSIIYTDSCQLPVPVWFVLVCIIPMYSYFIAFPVCHLMISLERILATVYSKTYENFRPIFGWIAAGIIFCAAASYTAFKVSITLREMSLTDRMALFLVQTKGADSASMKVTYALVVIDICTTLSDIILIVINRKKAKNLDKEYSLSHSYQLRENLAVALRLVFPLGLCNAVLFFGFLCGSGYLRYFKSSFDLATFQSYLQVSGILTVLQAPLSAAIVMLFLKRPKLKTAVVDASEHQRLYFDQFRKQVGTQKRQSVHS